jgi:predicted phosphoribosyltransferase
MSLIFADRQEAGRMLADLVAQQLAADPAQGKPLVLALPRGGVPVAYEVAAALSATLDVVVVRKLGVPGNEELALGAIASGGLRVLNAGVLDTLAMPDHRIADIVAREQRELERRERLYRMGHPAPALRDRTVILIDDGIATGSTMRVAISAMRRQHVGRVIVAAPVATRTSYLELREVADEMVTILLPKEFFGVSQFYTDFEQTTDREVITLLTRARQERWQAEAIGSPAVHLS